MNPYSYTPSDKEDEEYKVPIFYDFTNFFGPLLLLLLPMVTPVVINDYIIGIGRYYYHVIFFSILVLWPPMLLRIWMYYKEMKREKYFDNRS